MRLSKRIYAICDVVSHGETVADIGTDHGYVPMLLVKKGVSPYAIMSDISEGSLSKAILTFKEAGINCSENSFRVGDGLDTIESGEVDDIIIAGLGGNTIVEILDNDIEKTRSFSKLIMQPRKYSGTLRYYLYTHGFDIIKEQMAEEGKFVCEIITAVPSSDTERIAPYPSDDIRWAYPESLASEAAELLIKRLDWKFTSIDEEINNLKLSRSDSTDYIKVLESGKEYLKSLYNKALHNISQ